MNKAFLNELLQDYVKDEKKDAINKSHSPKTNRKISTWRSKTINGVEVQVLSVTTTHDNFHSIKNKNVEQEEVITDEENDEIRLQKVCKLIYTYYKYVCVRSFTNLNKIIEFKIFTLYIGR